MQCMVDISETGRLTLCDGDTGRPLAWSETIRQILAGTVDPESVVIDLERRPSRNGDDAGRVEQPPTTRLAPPVVVVRRKSRDAR